MEIDWFDWCLPRHQSHIHFSLVANGAALRIIISNGFALTLLNLATN